jgi:hypothetical protein
VTEPEIPLSEIVTHATVEIPLVALMAAHDFLVDLDDDGRDEARPLYDFLPLAARAGVVRDALRFSDPTAQGRALEEITRALEERSSAVQVAARRGTDR